MTNQDGGDLGFFDRCHRHFGNLNRGRGRLELSSPFWIVFAVILDYSQGLFVCKLPNKLFSYS